MRWNPMPSGMRLAHASMTFGAGESDGGDAQILNVGGSVAAPGPGAAGCSLSTPDKDAKPLSYYLRTAQLNVAELDYLGLAFRDVSLDLAVGERQLAHQRRRSQCERHDHRCRAPRIRPSPGICSSSACTSTWRRRRRMRRGPARERSGARRERFADPRSIPAINFHATELIWGERQFGDVTATLRETGRRHQPQTARP